MKPYVFLLLTVFLFYGCSKENTANDDPFIVNKEKWISQEIHSYTFDLTITCFCPVEFLGPNRISVQNAEIVQVNGVLYDESNFAYPTIDELFGFIEQQMALNPQVAEVQYNLRYGYPTRIYFDQSELIADEEIDYTISRFVPIR